jgi:hypothetical protein
MGIEARLMCGFENLFADGLGESGGILNIPEESSIAF